jgi:ribose/xylose/arabinose/galactoside ABC-type transport system permease subunit
MAYDDGVLRARGTDARENTEPLPRDASRFVGEGFRIEPDFRTDAAPVTSTPLPPLPPATAIPALPAAPTPALTGPSLSVPVVPASVSSSAVATGSSGLTVTGLPPVSGSPTLYSSSGDATMAITRHSKGTTPNLEYVFDDPREGEPGPDRILVHGLWELALALLVATAGYLLYRQNTAVFASDSLQSMLLTAAGLGVIAMAAALSLRTGAVNLSIGTLAAASGLYYAHHVGDGLGRNLLVVLALCAAVGVVQGLAVVGLHVPSWAASLAMVMGLLAWTNSQTAVTGIGGYAPDKQVYYWFGGFCVVSVAAGLIGIVPSVRRMVGRYRSVEDPAHRRGVVAAAIVVAATVGSSLLAGLAGVLTTAHAGFASPNDGLILTAFAVGAALLGGTSAYGRRGGIFGTVFAVLLITIVVELSAEKHWGWVPSAFAALSIAVGLGVTRMVEKFGRPPRGIAEEATAWELTEPNTPPNGWADRTQASVWRPATSPAGLWGTDDDWGIRR